MEQPWEPPAFAAYALRPRRTRYCVVVVTLDEGNRLQSQLLRMRSHSHVADIIIADGGSTDGSTGLDFLRTVDVRTLLVTHELGLSTATRMGLAYGITEGYDGIITVDGNGKDGIEAIGQFVAALDRGYDLVQGSRFRKGGYHKNTPFFRYLGIRALLVPLISLSGFRYSDPTNAFRALSVAYLNDPRVQPIREIFIDYNLQHYLIFRAPKLGFRVAEIPVSRTYPDDGTVPTKISSLNRRLKILTDLIATIAGRYDP